MSGEKIIKKKQITFDFSYKYCYPFFCFFDFKEKVQTNEKTLTRKANFFFLK